MSEEDELVELPQKRDFDFMDISPSKSRKLTLILLAGYKVATKVLKKPIPILKDYFLKNIDVLTPFIIRLRAKIRFDVKRKHEANSEDLFTGLLYRT